VANIAADKLYDHAVSAFRKRAHEIGKERGGEGAGQSA
jgi:hypothetical protein